MSGCASKVPIQPRSRLSPEREIVFHVTNNGCSSSSSSSASLSVKFVELLLWLVRLLGVSLLGPLGVELALCRLEELADEGGEARMRDIAAGLYEPSADADTDADADASAACSACSACSASVSSSSSEVVVGSELYFAQRCSTWARVREGRFSRLATRLSKQYAQCACVAMVGCWKDRR